MKYLIQFLIIIAFSFAGELLHYCLPLPIPASIYGIILLFLALEMKWVSVKDIRDECFLDSRDASDVYSGCRRTDGFLEIHRKFVAGIHCGYGGEHLRCDGRFWKGDPGCDPCSQE